MLIDALTLATGAFLGGALRAWCSTHLRQPWGTLSANAAATFLLGLVTGAPLQDWLLLILGTGVAGALSTWSTLAKEIATSLQEQQWRLAAVTITAHLFVGTIAWWAGTMIM
ncbi:camphor resistance protein CrcB [Corynebacterium ciconiae DSM 44920]|uniref:fluoride efflux transporter FluC n=1 Tax=Corynebacterium ciconiae TaxID=227319 RepID=UPI00038127DE|nr:CrcB family protein [Corynebacterium ciconiae]WKD61913.1 camphor resistance protein CrcB [Corynebacterium ciconiae DSM 44920]